MPPDVTNCMAFNFNGACLFVKVEYHANAKYENPLTISEKIACVGQSIMYPMMEKNTLPC